MPTIIPCRRRSNGRRRVLDASSVAAAPLARNHGRSRASASRSWRRRRTRRPPVGSDRRGSSPRRATIAWVVQAQAALTWVFGPRAPMISANCEWPIDSTRKRNRRSNPNGSRLDLGAQLGDQAIDLGDRRLGAVHPCPDTLQGEQLFAPGAVGGVAPRRPRRTGRSRGRPRRRSRRCRRGARRAAPIDRAAGCRAWWSCSASPAGFRRRAARRTRRRWPAGSCCRAPRRGRRRRRTARRRRAARGGRRA